MLATLKSLVDENFVSIRHLTLSTTLSIQLMRYLRIRTSSPNYQFPIHFMVVV